MQHALWVAEGGTAHRELGGVVVDDLADGEAVLGAGVVIRPAPGLTGSWRGVAIAAAHAFCLHTLAWVNIGGGRLRQQSLADGDDLTVDTAGDLQCAVDSSTADTLSGDFDLVAELHHPEHGIGPAGDGAVGVRQVLGGCREPHAVDQGVVKIDQTRGIGGGVDWVVIARDQREWGHVLRGSHGGAGDERAWGWLDGGGQGRTAPLRCWCWDASTGGAAADGEALHLGSNQLAGFVIAQFQLNGDDAPSVGLVDRGTPRFHVDAAAVTLVAAGKLVQWNP